MGISVAVLELGTVDLSDDSWLPAARQSIERLESYDPDVVHLSHDRTILRRQP